MSLGEETRWNVPRDENRLAAVYLRVQINACEKMIPRPTSSERTWTEFQSARQSWRYIQGQAVWEKKPIILMAGDWVRLLILSQFLWMMQSCQRSWQKSAGSRVGRFVSVGTDEGLSLTHRFPKQPDNLAVCGYQFSCSETRKQRNEISKSPTHSCLFRESFWMINFVSHRFAVSLLAGAFQFRTFYKASDFHRVLGSQSEDMRNVLWLDFHGHIVPLLVRSMLVTSEIIQSKLILHFAGSVNSNLLLFNQLGGRCGWCRHRLTDHGGEQRYDEACW